jgi:hypothetical protein
VVARRDLIAELSGPPRPLQLVEQAAVAGGLRYVELALFARLGRAAPELGAAALTVWASSASMRAAWRAEALEELLPVSVGLPTGEACTVPPGPMTAALVNEAETAAGWAADVYEVLLAAYGIRLSNLSAAADPPFERVLTRLVADLDSERGALRRLLEGPGRSP